jgi:hypothetical protein
VEQLSRPTYSANHYSFFSSVSFLAALRAALHAALCDDQCARWHSAHTQQHITHSPPSLSLTHTYPHCSRTQRHTPSTSTETRPSCCTWHTAAPQPPRSPPSSRPCTSPCAKPSARAGTLGNTRHSLSLSLTHILTRAAVLHLVAPRALAERNVGLQALRTARHPLARMLVSRPVLQPTG